MTQPNLCACGHAADAHRRHEPDAVRCCRCDCAHFTEAAPTPSAVGELLELVARAQIASAVIEVERMRQVFTEESLQHSKLRAERDRLRIENTELRRWLAEVQR